MPRMTQTLATDAHDAGAEHAAALLRALAPRVLSACRRVLGDGGESGLDAEDAAQEALLAIARALERGVVDDVRALASTIAVRKALNVARSRGRERARRRRMALDRSSGPGLSPEARHILADRLVWAIARLPLEQAEAVTLRMIFNHSIAEVAAATGVSTETVRSRLRLARNKLRSTLADTVSDESREPS